MNIQHILVPVDFSRCSERAFRYALWWGRQHGADVTVIHINTFFRKHYPQKDFANAYSQLAEKQEQAIRNWMNIHAGKMKESRLDFVVVNGRAVAHELLRYINRHPVNMVVMGTHGRSGASHLVMGSVAERVARLSRVPVLTIRENMEKLGVEHILVPLDFSDYSGLAVDTADTLAAPSGARLHLLHVEEHPGFEAFGWLEDSWKNAFEMDPETVDSLKRHLKGYAGPGVKSPLTLEVVRSGHACPVIVDYARDHAIDLIVMVMRGFNKFEYFWSFGSNTERILRTAPCPVLVIRQAVIGELQERDHTEAVEAH